MLRRLAVMAGLALTAVYLVVLVIVLSGRGGKFTVAGMDLRVNSVTNALRMLAVAFVGLAACSARVRAVLARAWRSPATWFACMAVVAWWLSLGPHPQSRGRELNAPGLYALLYEYVPGFNGLRVPARFSALVALGVSVLAGFGVRALLRGWRSAGPVVLGLGLAFLAESTAAPIPVNTTSSDKYIAPPARVYPAWQAPPVYQRLATLPRSSVILELPFGDPAWELRYVYYSTVHWLPLVNGYSGGFPESYLRLRGHLDDPRRAPDEAFAALMASGATHLVLHTGAYRGDEAREVRAWLETRGLHASDSYGPDLVYPLVGHRRP